MQLDQLDLPRSNGILKSIIIGELRFITNVIRPERLSAVHLEEMGLLCEHCENSLEQLLAILSRISTQAPDDAVEIERLAAQLARDIVHILHLSPIPTPNVLPTVEKAIEKKQLKLMSKGRAETPKALAKKEAYEAEFAKRVAAKPADWDGKKGAWTMARNAMKDINTRLNKQGVKDLSQDQIYRDLLTYIKTHPRSLRS